MSVKKQAKKRNRMNPWKIILPVALILVIAAGVGTYFYYNEKADLVYGEVYVEAGASQCPVSEFLKRPEDSARFSEDTVFDPSVPGDYDIKIEWDMPVFGLQTGKSVLHVTDSVAPEVTASCEKLTLFVTDKAPEPKDLIGEVKDISECSFTFADEYDFKDEGSFDVTVVVKDSSGNESTVTVPCTVKVDKEPPVIEGVEPIEIAQGDAIVYKRGVTVTDDCDDNPTLEVDDSKVNTDKRGFYDITYIATDAAGNKTEVTTQVHIVSAKIAEATADTVNVMADQILSQIITPGMTQLEQAKAIFDWTVNNITYSETAGIDDLTSAAYKGMYFHIGDCTVKQKTAEWLLNRMGIKNMEIEKIRDTRGHYWLLIDVGEGWYHYDPNLQLDGTLIFYWHDADLWAYSNAHKNTHNYDKSKYPAIQ